MLWGGASGDGPLAWLVAALPCSHATGALRAQWSPWGGCGD